MYRCRICGNDTENKVCVAREMMFGTKDEFAYFECSNCGCLQIGEIPSDLSRYYPEDYYSFDEPDLARCWVRGQWLSRALHRGNVLGSLLTMYYGRHPWSDEIKLAGVALDHSILDVGSGSGSHLFELRAAGFSDLTGIDQYIDHDVTYGNGVTIQKKALGQVQHPYDFVMLHHTFEHMSKPLAVLRELRQILKPSKFALIRTPVVPNFAWRAYGVNWVQLDAPRHLYLHSDRSMRMLAKEAGFEVVNLRYDSTEFQFWGSEQYARGISLTADNSYSRNRRRSMFSRRQIALYRSRAIALNKKNDGDSACFLLRKN